MMITCLCGCGQQPTTKGSSYLPGHFSRSSRFKTTVKHGRDPKPIDAPNPSGLCHCGCGRITPLARSNHPDRGLRAGQHRRFIPGHHVGKAEKHSKWKGGRYVRADGYIAVRAIGHPSADKDGYVLEHRLVAEKMLGRHLQHSEKVHHIDGVKSHNTEDNIIVLGGHAEHARLPGHGVDALNKWRAEGPERAKEHAREAGRKGANVKWSKH